MKRNFCLFLCLIVSLSVLSQSKLKKAKAEFEKDNPKQINNSSVYTYNNRNLADDTCHNTTPDIGALFSLVYYAFKGAYCLLITTPAEGSPFLKAEEGGKGFNQYPYAVKNHGLYLENGKGNKNQLLRLKAAYIHHNTLLQGLNAEIAYYPIGSVSFNYKLHQFWEITPEGENISLGVNRLMLNFHRIRSAFINIHYGLGVMFYKSVAPFSFELGAEIFPFKPISLEFDQIWSFNKGNILSTTDLELKYHLKNFAPYVAYQRLTTNYFPIESFMLGMQLIF